MFKKFVLLGQGNKGFISKDKHGGCYVSYEHRSYGDGRGFHHAHASIDGVYVFRFSSFFNLLVGCGCASNCLCVIFIYVEERIQENEN